ncbi:MAG: hypothetical protein M3512_11595 [Bacteroidota bacterium]|nr:hypothetical protein [Bacteroidota bacterium]
MENILQITVSCLIGFILISGIIIFATAKKKNYKVDEQQSILILSSIALIILISIFSINLLVLPWYVENVDPLKGYAITLFLAVIFIVNFSVWIYSILENVSSIRNFKTQKRRERQLKVS